MQNNSGGQYERGSLRGRSLAVLALLIVVSFLAVHQGNSTPISGIGAWASAYTQNPTTSPQDTGRGSQQPSRVSRRARALLRKTTVFDSTSARKDSLLLERLTASPRDSSVRLAQFHHVRKDVPFVEPARTSTHPLYLREPAIVRYQDVLDSTRWSYRIQRQVGRSDTKIPVDLKFSEYLQLRLEKAIRRNWEELAHSYEFVGEQKKGLSEVFGQVTKIEIPIPKSPLFSIFGENRIRIQINGSVDIHGAFRNTKSDQVTANPYDQVRNEPDFDQQVRVGVKGEIGDKLKIDADWDTERTFEYENQLKVRYQGYEDEIVQSVEAGNVSLQTNSSFISSSQALFGIKAGFQFGPLKLTTVASQKRGQIKELSVSGGGRPTPFEKRAHEYSRDHYFVDVSYRPVYDKALKKIPLEVDNSKQILDMEVWVSRTGTIANTEKERQAVAFIDANRVLQLQGNTDARRDSTFTEVVGQVYEGTFIKLEPVVDYTFDDFLGYISLNRSIQPEQIIAVAYTVPGGDVGTFSSKEPDKELRLVLKLVRPKNLDPSMKIAWSMLLKNIYPLGGRGIKKEGFKLEVNYKLPSAVGVKEINPTGTPKSIGALELLQVFRLDRFDEKGILDPDGNFDFLPLITINESRGELIFPTLEPFGDNIRTYFLEAYQPGTTNDTALVLAAADSFVFREVYDTTYNGAINSDKNNFYIVGNITSSVASSYNIGFNVVEGSVEVIVDGRTQTPNVDYAVDYLTGQVVIRNQSLLVPGKNLQIKYEANDLFQLASKSLLGARGELALAKNSILGFTVMSLNQQTLSDKVRLGEEPIHNTIFGIDGGTSLDLGFLTRALNWLPGIRTNAPSTLTMKGEGAYMLPDPNTRKSNIAQDNQQGIAYVDDFEGARRTIPLHIGYGLWKDASPPAYIRTIDPVQPDSNDRIDLSDPLVRQGIAPDSVKMEFKSKLAWYNILPSDVYIRDIWPNRETRAGEDLVTVLNFHYRPTQRGAHNYSLRLNDSLFARPEKGWAGVMHPLGTTATNLLDENVSFIEMWIRIERGSPGSMLNINLGSVSEDAIPNARLNTEDGLGGKIRTGIINDATQDIGIDERTDGEERNDHNGFITAYPQYESDPSGDNYVPLQFVGSLEPLDYAGYNGPDGNLKAEGGQFPNTEDLNSNNVVDRINSYFEYELALDTTSAGFKQFVTGGGENSWYQVRIPIKEFTRVIGNPSLTNIESIRLWFSGASSEVLVRLTEFNLVGNQWEALNRNDPDFKVSVVSLEENPFYSSPPGVQRPVDRTQPDRQIAGNEQSLALLVTGLPDGQSKQAIKRFSARPLDLFSYRTLKMFVHGDDRVGFTVSYVDTSDYDLEVFLRFGADSLNYYEYRAPLRPGWHRDNEINIRFADLTAIKLGRDSARVLSRPVPVPGGGPGAVYRVLGEPTLTNVRYLAIGVENPAAKGAPVVTADVWANELRLTDVDDTPGWAYRFDTSVKLADIGTIALALSQRDPFFHGLEERFGSRNTDRNWSLGATISFEKFLPEGWTGSQLPFSYSHVEAIQNPRYLPGTDILVDEAAERTGTAVRETGQSETAAQQAASKVREQTRTVSVTETYAVPNVRLSIPSNSWIVKETINRMSFGYSFTNTRRRNPSTEFFQQWGWNFRFGYGLQFSQNNVLEPFADLGAFFLFAPWKGLKVRYTPQSLNLGATLSRGQTHERARNQLQKKPVARSLNATRQFSFNWQLIEGGFLNPGIDYTLDVSSSLVHLEVNRFGRQRSLLAILDDIFVSDKLINFGIDQGYTQNININTRVVVPRVLKLDKIITPTLRYSTRYDWQNNFQAGGLGKSAGTTASLTVGLDINLKEIADEIWSPQSLIPSRSRSDTTGGGRDILTRIDQLTRVLIKAPFFDWERLNFSFTQGNTSRHSGVLGRPGFLNVFGRVPFFQESLPENGPSLLYQLGLSSDPHGEVVIGTKKQFPFVGGKTIRGRRAPLGNLTDVYNQSNKVTMRTSRTLWEGARVDLNWSVGWSYNMNRTLTTDSLGIPTERGRTVSGDVDRSFLAFPSSFIFKIFKTSIDDVSKKFERLKADSANDPRSDDLKLVEAFEGGLEALPIGRKIFSSIFPRPNYSFRWDGLEKLALFSGFTSRVSLDHAYTSTFRRRWKLTPTGGEVTEGQQISYNFSPLIGVNVTFKPLGKGNLTGTFRYGTATIYDLTPSSQKITESSTSDITISANYSRVGFEIPFFGLSLSNDIDVTFSYSLSKNNRRLYDFSKAIFKKEGDPLEGTNRTVIEPRIRYTLSARVSASIYYKHTRLKPDAAGSRIPGSTINEGGLDVRVQIN